MYFIYLWEVLKRAFTATPRMTDALQILAASALPAISTAFGLRLPDDAATLVLAYIGLAALTYFVIRLFCAPYAIWKEQAGEIGNLKLELTKPERMIMERLAKHRAKARAKLAGLLEDFQTLSFSAEWTELCLKQLAAHMTKIRRIEAEAGLPQIYIDTRGRLLHLVQKEGSIKNEDLPLHRTSSLILRILQSYLVGDITNEALAHQLPAYTELEIQP
jgi:hypothetical protein